jgi:hypothetical protein
MDATSITTTARPVTEEAQMLEWLEENFLPLDYHPTAQKRTTVLKLCSFSCFS